MKEEHLGKLLDEGISVSTITIFFDEEIDKDSASAFIKKLHFLDNYKDGTVTIKFTTEGGCVISGMRMYHAIRSMKNHVRGIIDGECSSMGTVVVQAFDETLMLPDSFMMLHIGDQTISGHPKNNENWLKLYKYYDKRCYEIYLEKINNKQKERKKKKLSLQELEKMLDFDVIMLPEKVISMGLADGLLKEAY
jgi:ATP-dependent protease ClpP protease subunit